MIQFEHEKLFCIYCRIHAWSLVYRCDAYGRLFSSFVTLVFSRETTSQLPPESGAISVVNQSAGSSVTIESVTVPQPGVWVAVREVNGSDLGNVLGAIRVNGPRSAISVPLLRATEPGLPYAVELYRTDGGEEFNLATNSVYVDFATGAPVIVHFTTTN